LLLMARASPASDLVWSRCRGAATFLCRGDAPADPLLHRQRSRFGHFAHYPAVPLLTATLPRHMEIGMKHSTCLSPPSDNLQPLLVNRKSAVHRCGGCVAAIKRAVFHGLLLPSCQSPGKPTLYLLAAVDNVILKFLVTGVINEDRYLLPSERAARARRWLSRDLPTGQRRPLRKRRQTRNRAQQEGTPN